MARLDLLLKIADRVDEVARGEHPGIVFEMSVWGEPLADGCGTAACAIGSSMDILAETGLVLREGAPALGVLLSFSAVACALGLRFEEAGELFKAREDLRGSTSTLVIRRGEDLIALQRCGESPWEVSKRIREFVERKARELAK